MKKTLFCLILIVVLINCSICLAEDVGMRLQIIEAVEPIEMIKDQLLVPSSLDLRSVGCIALELDDKSYVFYEIHYVAQNRMGGYTDNIAYALTTKVLFFNEENKIDFKNKIVVHIDDTRLGDDQQMHSDLTNVILEYLTNHSEWKSHTSWIDLPTDQLMIKINN